MSNKLINIKIVFRSIIIITSVILIISCRSRNKFAVDNSKINQIQSIDTVSNIEKSVFKSDSVYIVPDVQAGFYGGENERIKYFEKNLKFPENIHDSIKQEIVFLTFIVELDSTASRIGVIKGNELFNQEAIRLIKLAKWNPGKVNGQSVRSAFAIPVIFKRK